MPAILIDEEDVLGLREQLELRDLVLPARDIGARTSGSL